jgi:hypothetical protein
LIRKIDGRFVDPFRGRWCLEWTRFVDSLICRAKTAIPLRGGASITHPTLSLRTKAGARGSLPAPLIDSPLGNAALAQVLAGKSGMREGARLAHRVTPQTTPKSRRSTRSVPMADEVAQHVVLADPDPASGPVHVAPSKRHQLALPQTGHRGRSRESIR